MGKDDYKKRDNWYKKKPWWKKTPYWRKKRDDSDDSSSDSEAEALKKIKKEAVQKYDRKGFQGRIIRVEYAAESQNAPRDNIRQSNYPVSQKPNYFSRNMDDRMNNMMDQGRSGGMGVRDRNHRVNRLSIPNHRLSSSGGRTGIGGVGSGDGTLIQMRNECTFMDGKLLGFQQ